MKHSTSLFKGLVFSTFLLAVQMSFGQHPVIINDSLVVNQRLYAKEKLIVTSEAQFKQNIKVTGTSTFTGNITADGATALNGSVGMANIGAASSVTTSSQIVIIQPDGQLKKGRVTDLLLAMTAAPIDLNYCGVNGGIAQWWGGLNKLFTACPDVKVGIRTDDPQFPLHVVGSTYSQKYLAGNSGATMNALFNGFAQNTTDDLIDLGVKIGGGAIENRFRIKNDGTVYAKELRIRTVADFPDYVFEEDYRLISISELAEFIRLNNHLPNMPTATEVKEGGLAVGDVVVKLVEKVEELTLYTIQLNQENQKLRSELDELRSEIDFIKSTLNK